MRKRITAMIAVAALLTAGAWAGSLFLGNGHASLSSCAALVPQAPQADANGVLTATGTVTCADDSANNVSVYTEIDQATPPTGYCVPGPCLTSWTMVAHGAAAGYQVSISATPGYQCTLNTDGVDPGHVYRTKVVGVNGDTTYSAVASYCQVPNHVGWSNIGGGDSEGINYYVPRHTNPPTLRGRGGGRAPTMHVSYRSPKVTKDVYEIDCYVYFDSPAYSGVSQFDFEHGNYGHMSVPNYSYECFGNNPIVSVKSFMRIERGQTAASSPGAWIMKSDQAFTQGCPQGCWFQDGIPGGSYSCAYTSYQASYAWRSSNFWSGQPALANPTGNWIGKTQATKAVHNAPHCN